jgi:hypothetical protein
LHEGGAPLSAAQLRKAVKPVLRSVQRQAIKVISTQQLV